MQCNCFSGSHGACKLSKNAKQAGVCCAGVYASLRAVYFTFKHETCFSKKKNFKYYE